MGRPSFLMCRPTFYGIAYAINPWMNVHRQPNRPLALRQWEALRKTLRDDLGAEVRVCRARPGLPDMTFTANAGLVCERVFIPSRFRYKERAGETPHFVRWFRARGCRVLPLPPGHSFEGAGDALPMGKLWIAGYRFRSDIQTHVEIGQALGARVLSVELVNPHFYHLDTCFMPLSRDLAIYYPPAFDRYGNRVLRENVADLLPVRHDEAYQFACNAISVGRKVIISKPCHYLARDLEKRGFAVYPLDFSEFLKSGGAGRCLVLQLTG